MKADLRTRLRLAWPIMRLTWTYLDDLDAWEGRDHDVPLWVFGTGCEHEFRWYFDGNSRVLVRSPDDICQWLATCAYAHDEELFHLDDYWQHPLGFESIRRGDCEDHALWAWRKLVELGYRAELVTGRSRWREGGALGGHCWVVFEDQGTRFLFEPVAKKTPMIRPVADVRHLYEPHASVDQAFARRLYAGYVALVKEQREQKLAAKASRRSAKSGPQRAAV